MFSGTKSDLIALNYLRNNPEAGVILEGKISMPPCMDQTLRDEFKISTICNFIQNISIKNKGPFLKLMKFTKQSPTVVEPKEEYNYNFLQIKWLESGLRADNTQEKSIGYATPHNFVYPKRQHFISTAI